MKLKPLFDRVIAKEITQENTTKSGICLSLNNNFDTKIAKVVAIGEGIYEEGVFQNMKVNVGDKIYFEDHCCSKIVIGSEEFILLKQTDILAVEED